MTADLPFKPVSLLGFRDSVKHLRRDTGGRGAAFGTSEVKVAQVVGRHLLQRLLGAESHAAGEQDVPLPAGQSHVSSVQQLIRVQRLAQVSAALLRIHTPVRRNVCGRQSERLSRQRGGSAPRELPRNLVRRRVTPDVNGQ